MGRRWRESSGSRSRGWWTGPWIGLFTFPATRPRRSPPRGNPPDAPRRFALLGAGSLRSLATLGRQREQAWSNELREHSGEHLGVDFGMILPPHRERFAGPVDGVRDG